MDTPISKDQWEQLLLLKELTANTKVLHEVQILQIKMWSYIAFYNILPSELIIKIDIDNKKIFYEFDPKNGNRKKSFKKYQPGLSILQNDIKALLGNDWSIDKNVKII